jgi:hypothetical protein
MFCTSTNASQSHSLGIVELMGQKEEKRATAQNTSEHAKYT